LAGLFNMPLQAGRVQVTWDANPEPNIAGYLVYYGTSSGNYTTSLDVGNVTSATIQNLTGGQTYFFAAKAYNSSSQESDFSVEVNITIPVTNAPPSISGLTSLSAQMSTTTSLSSLDINDPDNPNDIMQLNVSASRGRLDVASSVPGGVTANQVLGNGSKSIQISAPLSAIRSTVAATSGFTYTGDPNLVGADTLNVNVADSGNGGVTAPKSASAAIPIQVQGGAIDTWRNEMFSAADLIDPAKEATVYGDNADPENDGVENLVEFALGLDAMDPGGVESAVRIDIVIGGGGTSHAALSFVRRLGTEGLTYLPEVSADQVEWSADPAEVVEVSVEAIDAEFELATFQDLTPVTPASPRFMRLRVERGSLQ